MREIDMSSEDYQYNATQLGVIPTEVYKKLKLDNDYLKRSRDAQCDLVEYYKGQAEKARSEREEFKGKNEEILRNFYNQGKELGEAKKEIERLDADLERLTEEVAGYRGKDD